MVSTRCYKVSRHKQIIRSPESNQEYSTPWNTYREPTALGDFNTDLPHASDRNLASMLRQCIGQNDTLPSCTHINFAVFTVDHTRHAAGRMNHSSVPCERGCGSTNILQACCSWLPCMHSPVSKASCGRSAPRQQVLVTVPCLRSRQACKRASCSTPSPSPSMQPLPGSMA